MARPLFPKSLPEFQAWFDSEEACLRYLVESRWPDGYACPRCSHDEAYELTSRPIFKCRKCSYQVSVTAGTVLHRTRLSLRDWFGAAYLVAYPHAGHLCRSTAAAARSQALRDDLGIVAKASPRHGSPREGPHRG